MALLFRQAVFAQQLELQARVIDSVVNQLEGDERVTGLWLGGSLGRDAGDALSDIDLVLIAAPDQTSGLVASLGVMIEHHRPAAFVHEAPWNAPLGGAQFNVLYDTTPLPIYVDWDVWPPVDRRPSGVKVLIERSPLPYDGTATVASIRDSLPRGLTDRKPSTDLDQFRMFMAPIIAKYAARGRFGEVDRMLKAMAVEAEPTSSLGGVLTLARAILKDSSRSVSETATVCVRRYLSAIHDLMNRAPDQ